jgi:ABC-type Zn uptake system ZnuABC Zn-binding protein ZnuA/ABC-type Mn2+/Zn2+ transport system permease subunit
VLTAFHLAFVQRGVLEVLLLAPAAGLLGTWVVMRGLAFYAHAVGTAAFPGLVLAAGLGFPAPVGAFAAALVFAFGVERLARRPRAGYDSLTALVLVAALAGGVLLASDVFRSAGSVDSLLFGSLLVVGPRELALAGVVSVLTVAATVFVGPRWLVTGFDAGAARAMGLRSAVPDALLLVLVAGTVIASLAAIGALLVTALLVVPAATVRVWTGSLREWQVASVALAGVEGILGLWLSVRANVPPGPTIAVLGGAVFVTSALASRLEAPLRRPIGATVTAAVAGVVLVVGVGAGSERVPGRLPVTVTTTQLDDLVRNVGGDRVDVHRILAANTDPHEYEPRPADVAAAADARVLFASGDGLDGWIARVLDNAGGQPRVVDLGAVVPVVLAGEPGGTPGAARDPHWWHDPRNAMAAVATIRHALIAADPGGRSAYEENAAAYTARLEGLDRGIAACMARVPAADRTLVSDHDAFGYFARRYGIRVVGAIIPSQSTQAQASAGDLAALATIVRREGVRAIFPERSLSPRLARQIADQTGARADLALYGDALGPAGSAGDTYIGMERANADAMVRGFSGDTRRCALEGAG